LIELAHVAGCSLDSISAKYGISRDAVWRHARRHMKPEDRAQYLADVPIAELAAKAAEENLAIIDYLRLIRSRLMALFQIAASTGDQHAAAALSGRLVEVLNTIGRVTGEISAISKLSVTNNHVHVLQSPVVNTMIETLLKALAPHPSARRDVIQALRELEVNTSDGVVSVPMIAAPAAEMVDAAAA
jgi:hypothetical protein